MGYKAGSPDGVIREGSPEGVLSEDRHQRFEVSTVGSISTGAFFIFCRSPIFFLLFVPFKNTVSHTKKYRSLHNKRLQYSNTHSLTNSAVNLNKNTDSSQYEDSEDK